MGSLTSAQEIWELSFCHVSAAQQPDSMLEIDGQYDRGED